jgi:hypothetical protein
MALALPTLKQVLDFGELDPGLSFAQVEQLTEQMRSLVSRMLSSMSEYLSARRKDFWADDPDDCYDGLAFHEDELMSFAHHLIRFDPDPERWTREPFIGLDLSEFLVRGVSCGNSACMSFTVPEDQRISVNWKMLVVEWASRKLCDLDCPTD